jgi:hypothetical protein
MPENKETLLFIPDISGFTRFVNETEIQHSKHIISELLEVIINSDKLGMTVSEIEGDAVFFYKDGVPDVPKILDQCKTTFINFHNHLRKYDIERICRCGACETASKLSLKFVIHKGNVERIQVKDHLKLHGSDVILVHRLCKNSVNDSEYALFTNSFNSQSEWNSLESETWVEKKEGEDVYDESNNVSYSWITLNPLHNQVTAPSAPLMPKLSGDKVDFVNVIKAPLGVIYENFTDFDKRQEWNPQIKDSKLHDGNLNRSGSLHTCLIGSTSLDIETLGRVEEESKIVYAERVNRIRFLQDVISVFTFEQKGDETFINAEVDYKIRSWLGRLFKPLVKRIVINSTRSTFKKLKKASEDASG